MRLRTDTLPQRRTHLCLWLVACTAACSVREGMLGSLPGDDGVVDGGVPAKTCVASPRVTLQGHDTCTGRLAATRFSNALCTCGNLQLADYLKTRGFDSNQGIYLEGEPTDTSAAVGVNGNYIPKVGSTDIGGSFSIAGGGALQLVGMVQALGDFYSAGTISVTGSATVSRNAWLGGNFSGIGPLLVGGDLHHSGTVSALPVLVTGTNQQQTVTVAPPCPCATSDLLDIPALVDAAKQSNDNSSLGIAQDALVSVAGAGRWTLSCGRIYLSRISGIGNLAIHVTGNVALFIDGSIDLKGGLAFDVDPGAEIDVFVKQDLLVQGALSLASENRPAAGRIWVGGTQPITLASPLIGNLYAPRAPVGALVGLEVWGSIFAGSFSGGAFATFFFDRAVLATGANCKAPLPPAGLCTQCQWCSGGTACVAGSCGSCKSDGECCSLSVCSNGSCMPLAEPGGS